MLAAAWPGDRQFDQLQPFPTFRWQARDHVQGNRWIAGLGKLAGLTTLLFKAIGLFARYRYRYIEWGHGYDSSILWILSLILPIKIIVYLHGHDLINAVNSPPHKWFLKKAIARSHAVICNSHFSHDLLRERLNDRVPAHIINPCVRPERFGADSQFSSWAPNSIRIRRYLGIAPTAIVMLTVCRLVRHKGVDRLIRLVPPVLQAGIDFHHIVCGGGDQALRLRKLADDLDLEGRVHFTGEVSDHQLAALYAACDLVAMLTFFDQDTDNIEGFGTVYAEAGYFQKPVIATDVGGVRDAVRHGYNGLLIDPLQPDATLVALLKLCRDAELRDELGKNGRRLATREPDFSAPYSKMKPHD